MQAKMDALLHHNTQNCFAYEPQDESLPGFCGNHIVEPGEDCDCGLDYRQCYDHCCYPGHLTDWHRQQNHSARPCHFHRNTMCLDPFHSIFWFGIVGPSIFISVLTLLTS